MRNSVKNKLKSNRGASLTFALLLFMVCAVIGSVVLASATAAGGRTSGSYDYDQRYFAVTSAAELLRDTLDGRSVTFTLTKTSELTQTTTYTFADGGASLIPSAPGNMTVVPNSAKYELKLAHGNGIPEINPLAPEDLLGIAAANLVQSKINATDDPTLKWEDLYEDYNTPETLNTAKWLEIPSGTLTTLPETLTLTVDGENCLKVTVKPELKSDGSLIFTLYNAGDGEAYILKMTLQASVQSADAPGTPLFKRAVDDPIDSDNDGENDGVVHTDYYDQLDARTATITWRVTGVEKAVAA